MRLQFFFFTLGGLLFTGGLIKFTPHVVLRYRYGFKIGPIQSIHPIMKLFSLLRWNLLLSICMATASVAHAEWAELLKDEDITYRRWPVGASIAKPTRSSNCLKVFTPEPRAKAVKWLFTRRPTGGHATPPSDPVRTWHFLKNRFALNPNPDSFFYSVLPA
jgi:hypothetical protein